MAKDNDKPSSIAQRKRGFMVAPSPMNAVKLELAVICCAGVLLWLAQGRITVNPMAQLLLLGGYGCVGMLWIVFRTRRVLSRAQSSQDDERRNYGQE
jgi:D-arabinose 1-dehydrogenase-like Zn-dependent alcohol dehydrogenase